MNTFKVGDRVRYTDEHLINDLDEDLNYGEIFTINYIRDGVIGFNDLLFLDGLDYGIRTIHDETEFELVTSDDGIDWNKRRNDVPVNPFKVGDKVKYIIDRCFNLGEEFIVTSVDENRIGFVTNRDYYSDESNVNDGESAVWHYECFDLVQA